MGTAQGCRDCDDVCQAVIQGPAVQVGQERGSWPGSKLGMALSYRAIFGYELKQDN